MTGTDAAPQPRHPLAQYPTTHHPSAHHPAAHYPAAHYPAAQRLELTEQLHGRTVADPYRWLEDPVDPRTITWATEQDRLARDALDTLPGRMTLAGELQRLLATGWVTVAVWRNERAFFTRREPDGEHAVLYVREPGTDGATTDRPALLTGYGGFALSRAPAYTASALAWVSAGGVWAQASLRGGGEEGEDWHRAGMREHKQNCFDDFHAAAQALVGGGWTTPDQLAISGGSNGGLLVGAALTQRPQAYRAVVCSAPLLDMVRYERFLLGRTWNDEFGTAEEPTEPDWLLSYSPYHQVRPGTAYPAVLFTVFDSDTRVDPSHARKMCAALQHATTADPARAPVLIRCEVEVGHASRAVSRTVALTTDQLCFLAHYTGLDLEAVHTR